MTGFKNGLRKFSFDLLEHITQHLEADQDSSWEYDSAAMGVGQLAEACTVTGSGAGVCIWQALAQDAEGRVTRE